MTLAIRIAALHFKGEPAVEVMGCTFGPDYDDGREGTVVYVVDGFPERGGGTSLMAAQPFSLTGERPCWKWDGDRAAPSLTPSFGWVNRDGTFLAHHYLTKGRIRDVGDGQARAAGS